MNFVDKCDVCSNNQLLVLDKRKSKELDICADCGLIFQNPQKTSEDLKIFYENEYKKEYEFQIKPSKEWIAGNKRVAEERYDFLKRWVSVSKDWKVLDIGSSTGEFLRFFKNGIGIEPSKAYAGYSNLNGIKTLNIMFEDYIKNEKFELISMFHVLDFFQSPRQTLIKIHGLLSDGGFLFIENPNRIYPYGTLKTFFADPHLYTFSLKVIKKVLGETGFEVIGLVETKKRIRLVAKKSVVRSVVGDNARLLIQRYAVYKWKYCCYLWLFFLLKKCVCDFVSKHFSNTTVQKLKKLEKYLKGT